MTGTPDDEADREQADRDHPDKDAGRDDELDAAEVDERFAALIADFDDTPQWPDANDNDDEDEDDDGNDDRPRPTTITAERTEPTLLELWDTELPADPDEPEETYVPPPAPPVPRPSTPAVLGVLLIIAGLTLIVSPELLGAGAELGILAGIGGFLGGSVMLVWRLRPEPDEEDDDPGNGAVV